MIFASSDIEISLWNQGYNLICGVDEVGRGCFAGPVVAGAVVFSSLNKIPDGIADSKLLKPETRDFLAEKIKECAEAWAVGLIDVTHINKLGIGKATQMAFRKALSNLSKTPDFVLIDAFYINHFKRQKQKPVKNGDKLSVSIAAASIIAKVFRDNLMGSLESEFPGYGFSKNKGYGTKFHQEAIKKFGLSKMHRLSFNIQKFLDV